MSYRHINHAIWPEAQRLIANGGSIGAVAMQLGLAESTLYAWVKEGGPKSKLSPLRATIAELHKKGVTAPEVRKMTGASKRLLLSWARENGVSWPDQRRRQKHTGKQRAIALLKEGWKTTAVAVEVGAAESSVRKWAFAEGLRVKRGFSTATEGPQA